MFRSSFPIGRLMGVELRLHASLPPLLILALIYSEAMTRSTLRGFGLCLALLLAIIVRETVRALAAAYKGLHLRALLIFPVGGIMAFSSTDTNLESSTRLITLVTPLANIAAGFLILGLCYGVDPHVQLFAQPWISANHILRSIVWTQFALGAVSLLPVASISSRRIPLPRPRGENTETATPPRSLPSINIGTLVALALITAGFALMHVWLVVFGTLLLATTALRPRLPLEAIGGGSLLVSDAMQSDYKLLSSSDTLLSALQRTIGSTQDIFPVVRGDRLVGSISRDTITSNLQADGDGYLQGVMTRTLPLASPTEQVSAVLRRSAATGANELIAVFEDDAIVGILTHQGVLMAMQRTAALRPLREREQDPGR